MGTMIEKKTNENCLIPGNLRKCVSIIGTQRAVTPWLHGITPPPSGQIPLPALCSSSYPVSSVQGTIMCDNLPDSVSCCHSDKYKIFTSQKKKKKKFFPGKKKKKKKKK